MHISQVDPDSNEPLVGGSQDDPPNVSIPPDETGAAKPTDIQVDALYAAHLVALEQAWLLISNVNDGDWTSQSQAWRESAASFRDAIWGPAIQRSSAIEARREECMTFPSSHRWVSTRSPRDTAARFCAHCGRYQEAAR